MLSFLPSDDDPLPFDDDDDTLDKSSLHSEDEHLLLELVSDVSMVIGPGLGAIIGLILGPGGKKPGPGGSGCIGPYGSGTIGLLSGSDSGSGSRI